MEERFSEEERRRLSPFVSNVEGNVFVLRDLPEVIKGALFSRYSRSTLSLRSLLLKEFLDEVKEVDSSYEGNLGVKKASDFYDRILDGYGDDSIGELGGAHLALEEVSMIAAKAIEDVRIGGSPLEKSTRYIYFDEKVRGQYRYYREPILMTSAYRDLYVATCDHLFETYSKLIPPLMAKMEERFPRDPETPKGAYNASLRAKVLDCLRGLLPASTLTNVGVFGNGRFFEGLLQKMLFSPLAEMQDLAKKGHGELSKVIPSFVRRADSEHRHCKAMGDYREGLRGHLKEIGRRLTSEEGAAGVKLVYMDTDAAVRVAVGLLFPYAGADRETVMKACQQMSRSELGELFESVASIRKNRRHKSPRGLEEAFFTFEIVADFGAYRDLQRHRMLTQERQLLGCRLGYYVPQEIMGSDLEAAYVEALDRAADAYETIAAQLPEEAQYVVPMAYNIRWSVHVNLRALQWLTELRSQPQGHPSYRLVAQKLAQEVCCSEPLFAPFFGFVDYEGADLGRLEQEVRKELKR